MRHAWILAACSIALAAAAESGTPPAPPEGPPTPATEAELAAIRLALDDVLADSESARFKGFQVRHTADGGGTACGQVNAKNRFGAYVGYQPINATLIALNNGKVMAVVFGSDPTIATQLCKEHGM